MEAWVRPGAAPAGWRSILTKEQSGGLVYGLYANSDTNRPSVNVFIGREQDTRGTFQLTANTWVHLAATYDGTTLRMYVNGALASSKTLAGSIPTSTGLLRIGANTVWGEHFNGLIDEVRIYNRPLSAAEIQTDMNTPVTAGGGPAVTVPSSISLSIGSLVSVFTATAGRVSTTTTVQLTATSGGVSRSLNLTVLPGTSLLSLDVSRSSAEFSTLSSSSNSNGEGDTTSTELTAADPATPNTPKKLTVIAPEEIASVNGEIVRFQVDAFEPNNLPLQLTASDLPPGAQFDAASKELTWHPNTQLDGKFPITFTATSGTGETSSARVVISVMSGAPVIENVVNAATRSSEGACSPGAIATIQGKSLAHSHDEIEVLINGEHASLIQTSPSEITIQCPDLPSKAPLQVQVGRGLAISNTFDLTMSEVAPGLFSADNSGKGDALISLSAARGLAEQLLSETAVADGAPNTISLLATGFGSNPSEKSVALTMGGVRVPVQSAVEERPGLWRISALLPEQIMTSSQVPVQLTISSDSLSLSSNTVMVPIDSSSAKLRAD